MAFVQINLDEKGLKQKKGFIDKSGKFRLILTQNKLKLQEPVHFLITQCSPFSQGLSKIYTFLDKDLKYGLIDKNGRLVLEVKYNAISDFSEGLASVKKGQKWGYIDKTGKFVIEPKFD